MPTRFTLTFELDDPTDVLPSGLHELTCSLLDPPRGTDGQTHPHPRPFAITPLRRVDDRHWEYDLVVLPDGAEAAELEASLEHELAPYLDGAPRRFGRAQVRFAAHLPAVRWDRATTWETLAATPAHDVCALALCSPVVTRVRDRTNPAPDLRSLLDGVARRWQAFDPETTPDIDLWAEPVDTCHVEVRLLPYRTVARGRPQAGLVGHVVVDLRRCASEARQAIGALLAAAEHLGLGSGTAYGMGVVQRLYADRPAPTYYWTTEGSWAGVRRRILVGCAGGVVCTPLPGTFPVDLPVRSLIQSARRRADEHAAAVVARRPDR